MNKNIKIFITLSVVVLGTFYFFSARKNNPPTPTQIVDQTDNWKTYQNEKVTFKFPSRLEEKPLLIQGSGYTQEFADSEKKYNFTFSSTGNYSQITGKPYVHIDEFINMPYKVKTVTIDGQEGRQALPRAGSENSNSVHFFSKDSKFIYTLELKTGNTTLDTSEAEVASGKKLFDQILSTFKFITKAASAGTSGLTAAETPNAVIYEAHFYPNNANNAKSDYKGLDYIKFHDQKKVSVFNNGKIYFEYEPNKYILSYQIFNNPPEGPKEKQTQIINLEDTNNKYKLVMKLHMYGIGGGCSDFPKGYEMVSTTLDNKNIFKAKFIDEKNANLNWPLGNIYLVDKGQYGWNCPNVAGLSSVKNGSVDIQYDLSLFGRNYNSQDYIAAEKSLDKVVSTIRNFWQ